MTGEEAIKIIRKMLAYTDLSVRANLTADMVDACHLAIKALEQEPILDKINKMKSEIADSLEFWDYSPNNNPLARDMLETITNFLGDIKAESET